jgi:hypothetical protein
VPVRQDKGAGVQHLLKPLFWGKTVFMYLRAVLCSFQISVDFYCVPVVGRGGGRGGGEEGVPVSTILAIMQEVCSL